MVASSKYLGALPESLRGQDEVTWVPVDLLSKIIVELVERDSKVEERAWTKYYHLANPKMSRWEQLVPVIQDYYSSRGCVNGKVNNEQTGGLQVVSLEGWLKRLEASGRTSISSRTLR